MIKKIEIDLHTWQTGKLLFPKEIYNDSSVLYHGTSNINEAEIESVGITPSKQLFSKEDIFSVIKSFINMGWHGSDTGAFNVLLSYSKWDYSRTEGNPIFFHYDPTKCLTYAEKDFIGGEKTRSIRKCGRDLKKMLSNTSVYEKYIADFTQWGSSMSSYGQQLGISRDEIRIHTLEEIEIIYNRHQHLWIRSEEIVERHKYGVIYAVKFNQQSAKDLRNGNGMGILSFSDILPDQILDKIIVDDHIQKSRRIGDDIEKFRKWLDSDFYKSLPVLDKLNN